MTLKTPKAPSDQPGAETPKTKIDTIVLRFTANYNLILQALQRTRPMAEKTYAASKKAVLISIHSTLPLSFFDDYVLSQKSPNWNQDYVLVAGDLNAKHASWSPIAQQNVAGHTIRRFCDSTGYTLNAPLELTHIHKNLRNTVIDLAICKGPMGLHYSTEDKVNLVADSLESSFQENPEPYDDDFIDHMEEKVERYTDRNARRHTAPLTSPEEITDIILNLNNKKAPGKDGIKNIALGKSLPLNAITCITKIFNRSLQFNYFPKEWKHAQITVLPKPKKDTKFAENYRPISLLSCLGKIYE
ncbi:RNA-directed DNA polymerase from mobile element jockey [Trichonephila clavipes]|nr:RNA-directed DNA polymerase from mobile element jockey [Trichonephila clavipes]